MNSNIRFFFILLLSAFLLMGCDTWRNMTVKYDASRDLTETTGISVSANQWNYGRITMKFELPDGVLVTPANVKVNGVSLPTRWAYFESGAKMVRKWNYKTEPFTTYSEEFFEGEQVPNVLTIQFDYDSRLIKETGFIQVDISERLTLAGSPVFPEPLTLSFS